MEIFSKPEDEKYVLKYPPKGAKRFALVTFASSEQKYPGNECGVQTEGSVLNRQRVRGARA